MPAYLTVDRICLPFSSDLKDDMPCRNMHEALYPHHCLGTGETLFYSNGVAYVLCGNNIVIAACWPLISVEDTGKQGR